MSVKRARVVDSLIVVALLVLHVLLVEELGTPAAGRLPAWGAVVAGAAGIAAMLVRRRFPVVVFVVVLGAALVLILGGYPTGAVGLGLQVALYTVAANSSVAAVVAASVFTLLVATTSYVTGPGFEPADALSDLVILCCAVGLGTVTRLSRQRARQLSEVVSQLEAAQEQLQAEVASVERNRIARELHDIVTHSLGVIAVRAGVARAMPDDQEQAREALGVIEVVSKDALSEMRHLLGALRVPDATDTELRPQPTLDQLDDLFRTMRDVGLALTVQTEGEPYRLTAGRELTVYRIVQEALTNVLKHAGHAEVRVHLRYLDDHLRIEVLNDGAHEQRSQPGYGLVGMRERAVVCGGTLETRPLSGGRFQVIAALPRELARV